jgi:hypothetical protein
MAEIQDPMTKASDARRYFLNQPSTDTDRYMNITAWNAAAEPEELAEGTEIVLGYDGSRKDDATVLVACRITDGKIFQLECWERPPGPAGYGWEVPRVEVDEAVRIAFVKYKVHKIWADPSGWQSYLDAWNSTFADKVVAVYPSSQRKLMAQGLTGRPLMDAWIAKVNDKIADSQKPPVNAAADPDGWREIDENGVEQPEF